MYILHVRTYSEARKLLNFSRDKNARRVNSRGVGGEKRLLLVLLGLHVTPDLSYD